MNLAQHPSQWSWSQSSLGRKYFIGRNNAPRVRFAFSLRQSAISFNAIISLVLTSKADCGCC
jgi:hypothetical protein